MAISSIRRSRAEETVPEPLEDAPGLSWGGLLALQALSRALDLARAPGRIPPPFRSSPPGWNSSLAPASIDIDAYTTVEMASDLEALRVALDYERINIYGVSWGTVTALAFLRQYPDRARSVVLDLVYPPNSLHWAEFTSILGMAFDEMRGAASRR